MREYQRTTKEQKFNELPAETIHAFRKFIEKQELGSVETEILMCCETVSTPIKQGFFGKLFGGGNFAQNTAMFFTPERLFWCVTDKQNERTVLSARLADIEVKDYTSNLIEDNGLEIFGFINQSPRRTQAFLGLGEEEAAQKFRQLLKEIIEKTVK